jgi:DNA modification methylase
MTARLLQGDMREKLAELADSSVDSIVTDPPYHLTTGKKGGSGMASLNVDSPAGRSRIGTGFMGMKWDGGDVAMQADTWALLLRVAKPGAHLLAFGGSRTFHRVWCAVEDAGWEIRDTICGCTARASRSRAIRKATGRAGARR